MLRTLTLALGVIGFLTVPAFGTFVTEVGSVGMEATFGPGGLGSVLEIHEDNNYAGTPDFVDGTLITAQFSDGSSDEFGAPGLPDSGLGDFILEDVVLQTVTFESGIAVGTFAGGTVVMRDEVDNTLFTADIAELVLKETDILGETWLVGGGTYVNGVTTIPGHGGLSTEGSIVNLVFDLSITFDDFATPFEATANVNFIPEPGTMALILLSGMALFRRR